MKIRRIALGLSAVAAGFGLIAGAFAVGVSDGLQPYVKVDAAGKVLQSPAFVVGDSVPGSDVIGAVDVAAALVSHYAVQEKTTPSGGVATTVTGGVDLATSTKKLYVGSQIRSGKEVLTKDDLPSILPDGTFEDSDGNEYTYTQYIYVGEDADRKVTFGQYDSDLDPGVYVSTGYGTEAQNKPLYTVKIVFDKAINFSSDEVRGQDIELLGNKYTVANEATNSKIVLYGSALKETLDVGVEKTITFEGNDYTLKLVGIASDQNSATITVNGEYKSVEAGKEYTVAGLTFYVDEIVRWDVTEGQGYGGFVKISIGSNKIIFEDGQPVQMGDDEEEVDGTYVTLTGTGEVSVIEVGVAAADSDEAYIASGESFTDPVFGNFKVAFAGITPGEEDESRDAIDVTTSGKYAYVEFTDYKGNKKKVDFAYYDGSNVALKSNKENIVVVEGNKVYEDDFVVVNAGEFPHMLEVTEIKPATASNTGSVKLRDVFSGATYEVNLPKNDNDVEKVIDGQTYYINVTENGDNDYIQITWKSTDSDTGVGYGEPGTKITLFPGLKTAKGAYVIFAANTSADDFDAGDKFVLPDDTEVANGTTASFLGVTIDIKDDPTAANGIGLAGKKGDAAIFFLEEETDDNSPGAGNRYGAFAEFTYDSSDARIEFSSEPILADGTGFLTLETNDDYSTAVDYYGTYFKYASTDKTSLEIRYPDDQAIATVAIGSNPTFSTSVTEAGTYNEAVAIEQPVAKFASEIPTDSTLNQDLILVGGPCANAIVKKLLDEKWNVTDSCAGWSDHLGTNNALLSVVEDVFGSGKKALIIAGTTKKDTRALCQKVMDPTFFEGKEGDEWMGSV